MKFLKMLGGCKEIILIIILATLLRTWSLNQYMIFYGDAARDLLAASTAVQTGQLPLLGIPSSVPRFHQGPLSIWMEMLVYAAFGHHLLPFGIFFALLSILAVIFLYELLTLYGNKKIALVSAFLLSVFPLAVANGRTPYHTTPIPLFLVLYFFGLMQLWQNKKHGLFWSILTFCLLFQFELATAPLSLIIIYIVWRRRPQFSKHWKQLTAAAKRRMLFEIPAALAIGLLPQLLYDFTHRFEHLGGFVIWVGYRIVAFFGYKGGHTFSLARTQQVMNSFQMYLSRTWTAENAVLFMIVLILFVLGIILFFWQVKKKQKISPIVELAVVGVLIQTAAYFVHGSPSEAYFPPYFILTAIILGNLIAQFIQEKKPLLTYAVITLLITYGGINVWQIAQHHFFVNPSYAFNYDYGVDEQRKIVSILIAGTKGHLALYTTQPEGKVPTYFDNLRWLLAERGIQEDQLSGQPVFVESKKMDFPKVISYMMVPFPSRNVYFIEKGP